MQLGRPLTEEEKELIQSTLASQSAATLKEASLSVLPAGIKAGSRTVDVDHLILTVFGDKTKTPSLRGSRRDKSMPSETLTRAVRFEKYGYGSTFSSLYKAGEKGSRGSVTVPVTKETSSGIDDIRLYLFKEGFDVPYASDYDRVEMTPVNGGYIVRFVNPNNGAGAETLDKNSSWDEYSYTLISRTPDRVGDVVDFLGSNLVSAFLTLVKAGAIWEQGTKGPGMLTQFVSKYPLDDLTQFFEYASTSTLLPRGKVSETIHCSSAERLHYSWDAYSGKFVVKPKNAEHYENPLYVN